MQILTAILLDGLSYAAWLFMVAVGMTLIFGVMRILNIAHGAFYAIGAYACVTALGAYYAQGWPAAGAYLAMALAAIVTGMIVGLLIEGVLLRRLSGRDEVLMVLVTYALFLMLEDGIKLIWGAQSYFIAEPYSYLGFLNIAGVAYPTYDLLIVALAVVTGLAMWFWLARTRTGKLMIAIVADREIAAAMGINVKRMFAITFAVGTVLAMLGGAFTAPKIAVTASIGAEVIILAFAVVVIGGLGSVPGAAVGAVIAGMARSLSVHLAPEFELFAIYAVMAIILAVRPNGLFARQTGRKI